MHETKKLNPFVFRVRQRVCTRDEADEAPATNAAMNPPLKTHERCPRFASSKTRIAYDIAVVPASQMTDLGRTIPGG
jgi:hypothetical protein